MITNEAKRITALLLAGSLTNNTKYRPSYFTIGTGSGTTLASTTTLVSPLDRQLITSTDATYPLNIVWQGDWNSLEISGNSISEFGVGGSAVGFTGSMYSRTGFPSILFDGTNELRIEESWVVY